MSNTPAIASALKSARTSTEILYVNARTVCDANALLIADALTADNPNFDRDQFLKDCGVTP